jgi:sigma-E factor negative regulatory protein RseA
MNEELDSQLSAMFDDELPEDQCQLLARRLSRDEALKARWRRYAVIGAAVRAERGVRLDTNLAERVSAVISAEPALTGESVVKGESGRGGGMRWWQPVAGGAIAAGVAAMSVMWIRAQAPVGESVMIAQNSPAAVIASPQADTPAESYVVPASVERTPIVPTAELANYVVAHSEYSAPMSRRNLISALIASESGTAGIPDESEVADDGTIEIRRPNQDPNEDQAPRQTSPQNAQQAN